MPPDDNSASHFSADAEDHHTVLSRLDKAYKIGRKAYDEGQAIMQEVSNGDVIGDGIMGGDTDHLKRAIIEMERNNDNK